MRQLVMALLPGGGCTAALMARHLAAQGQNFSGLLHDLRCEWLRKHLRQGQLSLADSATMLWFACQSPFAYWFRNRFSGAVFVTGGWATPSPLQPGN